MPLSREESPEEIMYWQMQDYPLPGQEGIATLKAPKWDLVWRSTI